MRKSAGRERSWRGKGRAEKSCKQYAYNKNLKTKI